MNGGAAFQELYEREVKRVWHYFRRRGVSEVDTADLVQEVFVRTYSGWEKFVPDNRSAWLFGFVWRVYCEHVRKRVREIIGGDLDDLESGMAHDERHTAVTLELDKLKKSGVLTPLAEQVLCAKLQGKPERQIALELGQAAWQVREAYEKVVQELRERMGARPVDNEAPESTPPEGRSLHEALALGRAEHVAQTEIALAVAKNLGARDQYLEPGSQIDPLAGTDQGAADFLSEDSARAPTTSGYYLKPGLRELTPFTRGTTRQSVNASRRRDNGTQGNT
jgi:RNA polymerase sigma factor (sigma-70 family)